jgi:hypothetical protein
VKTIDQFDLIFFIPLYIIEIAVRVLAIGCIVVFVIVMISSYLTFFRTSLIKASGAAKQSSQSASATSRFGANRLRPAFIQ